MEVNHRLPSHFSAAKKWQDTVRVMLTDKERKKFLMGFFSTQAMSRREILFYYFD
jgi:hypothetical protein